MSLVKKKMLEISVFVTFFLIAGIFPQSSFALSTPDTPDGLKADVYSASEIYLTWEEADDATSYYIYRSVSSNGTYSKIGSTDETSYLDDEDLDAGKKYYYKVRAHNSAGTSGYSSIAYVKTEEESDLDAPDDLKATAKGSAQIKLTWEKVDDATSYYVYRSISSNGTYSKIGSIKGTSYTDDEDLDPGKKYYYKVRAHSSAGTSAYSDKVYATTDKNGGADAPENLKAESKSASQIKLTWDEVDDADVYYVYRALSSSGTYSKITTVSSTSYTDSSLSAGTTYYYKVQVKNGSSETSTYSNAAHATTASDSDSASGTVGDARRIAGGNRYDTAAKVAETGWTTSYYAVIVSGEQYPDALCSAPLAYQYNAPILLTSKNSLESQTRAQLLKLKVKSVYIIGGTGVISYDVEQTIRDMGIAATRIAGADRYDTSLKVAKVISQYRAETNPNRHAVVATGLDFPDALSIASIAAIKGYPILLTPKDSLREEIKIYLNENFSSTTLVGTTDSVSAAVFDQLPSPDRLTGTDPYTTNLAVIKAFQTDLKFDACYLATGQDYPDVLAGVALASLKSEPIFLVGSTVNTATLDYIKSKEPQQIIAFGGTGAVSDAVLGSFQDQDQDQDEDEDIDTGSEGIPSVPDDLEAEAVSSSEIELSWDKVKNADLYYIYRSTSAAGTYTNIGIIDETYYVDDDLDADETYYYKVKAYNSRGTSDYSNRASAATDEY
ncbi:cell wall binding repeat 2-containing protein [Syntrophobotulus glycolicus DSM 8271]|uniref:Cell wall binding repeat 2-containing protein n=1 Tax=Syntrophobotulus glycolicus (strain DSM 8271 / FlGlyR) TaxID=645991 RepID=F0SZU1_SYNGF|nr:cell wall-binding repeat-containing protein [Syntrophobotulus glycolicus]ADY57262.1 cell wall binding repeat 2-containing protein [Syntrophobotulus glycolicus DSM 8271]